MTIYELTDEYKQLLEMMEDEDVDPEVLNDTLEAVGGELEAKADAYAKVRVQLESDANGIAGEIERLTKLKKYIEGNADTLKRRLQEMMEITGKTKFETELFKFSIRNNAPSVVVDDMSQVPFDLLKFDDPKPNKTEIKKYIGEHPDITWAHLETSRSLVIK